jgi:NAD(P)-dependent dehydrogenase (short-subunit alcohol dehydrogenase family)
MSQAGRELAMIELAGASAVITGGATGIGLALARQLGARGARLILFEPRRDVLEAAVVGLIAQGFDAAGLAGDVTKVDDVEALADFAWDRHGRADLLINNAGVGGPAGGVFDCDLAEACALFDVNFFGVWHGIQVFGRRFRADGLPSAIYSTASENALFNALPAGRGGAYVASKHAVLGLMDVLRREAAAKPDMANIALGVIIPGWVATPLSRGMGMDADQFAAIIFAQMQAGDYYLVSHAHNMVRIDERHAEIAAAYARSAPRYAGDEEWDVQMQLERMLAAQRDS